MPAAMRGRYTARLDLGAAGGAAPPAAARTGEERGSRPPEVAFVVLEPTSEWDDPAPNFEALDDLAARTGGSFVELQDAAQVPDRIPDRSVKEVVGRAVTAVWDSAALMLLLTGVMIAEWALRKWWRLN
jgi:hypothetical protein